MCIRWTLIAARQQVTYVGDYRETNRPATPTNPLIQPLIPQVSPLGDTQGN